MFKLSQIHQLIPPAPTQTAGQQTTSPISIKQFPLFDVEKATAYNTKSENYFKPHEQDIKRVLGTTAEWISPEFAQAVYDWQGKNGFDGKWIDGKFGPATMSKLAKNDPALKTAYDPYLPYKQTHENEQPSKKVMALTDEVEKIRNEMGEQSIPLSILIGWIQVESNGNLGSKGLASLDEKGLFQISKDESAAIGVDHSQVGNDVDFDIRTGIKLARYHAGKVDEALSQYPQMAQYFPKDSESYWKLAMFGFSAGDSTMRKLIGNMANSGEAFDSWEKILAFAAENPSGYKHSPVKWLAHITKAEDLGNKAVGNRVQASVKVHQRIKSAVRKARMLALSGE